MAISATQKLSDLKKRVRGTAWDVLHVTGVDTHQATWFIDTLYDELAGKRTIWNSIVDPSGRSATA